MSLVRRVRDEVFRRLHSDNPRRDQVSVRLETGLRHELRLPAQENGDRPEQSARK